MVDIRTLLRNQDAKLRQQRTQFWKDALAKQDKDFLDTTRSSRPTET